MQGRGQRLTIEFVKQQLAEEGYEVLTDTYRNNRTPFKQRCPNGHVFERNYKLWDHGKRCEQCKKPAKFVTQGQLRDSMAKEGYELIVNNWDAINKEKDIQYKCPQGHVGPASIVRWMSGQRCYQCNVVLNNKGLLLRHQTSDMVNRLSTLGFTIGDSNWEYRNNTTKIPLACNQGHTFLDTWNNIRRNSGCRECKGSTEQKDLTAYIRSIYNGQIDINDRSYIKSKDGHQIELDIVLPQLRAAVEYCGLHFHGHRMRKHRKYHLHKLEECEKIGMKLITIFSDEWNLKRDVVKSSLASHLGINHFMTKLHARKCEIRTIDPPTARGFIATNHLQTATGSNVRYGAFHEGELVAVMTFKKSSAFKDPEHKYEWELDKYANKVGYHIRGIAFKLFTQFKRDWNPKSVKTHADRRWSTGGVYVQLGFKFLHNSPESYWYFRNSSKAQKQQRFHRSNFMKHKLRTMKDFVFDPNKTEKMNMLANGWDFIYDCGTSAWVWTP
jgi:tmRNA-binding protein